MNDKKTSSGGSVGFVGLLTLLFIALKLTRNIDWSWWWVLSPLWISTLICLLIVVIGIVAYVIAKATEDK